MKLNGIATSLSEKKEGNTMLSLTTLDSTSGDEVYVDSTQQVEFDPSKRKESRETLMHILDAICSYRAQLIDIGEQTALIPLSVVHGVPEEHPAEKYALMIRSAFPEYFSGRNKPRKAETVNDLLQHLFLQHFAKNGPKQTVNEPSPQIALHDYELFLPEDLRGFTGIPAEEIRAGELMDIFHRQALRGKQGARHELENCTRIDARKYAEDLQQKGILESTRFVLFGPRRKEFQECSRYTYLEWFDLKDHFTRAFIQYLPEPHNVCVKTPNDEPSPHFADITATCIADAWDAVVQAKTGKPQNKRHVFARNTRE